MRLPKSPPRTSQVIQELVADNPSFHRLFSDEKIAPLLAKANDEGWNWEDCSYRAGSAGLAPRRFWALVKVTRIAGRVDTPVRDLDGKPFTFHMPNECLRILHRIDSCLGRDAPTAFPQIASKDDEIRFLLASLREEAVSSSIIEGATTTRRVAVEMIRSQRAPQTPGERMIFNNYRAIRYVSGKRSECLDESVLFEIQRTVTEGSIEPADAAGRFRKPDESVAVWDEENQEAIHQPPPASELADRVGAMYRFANAPSDTPFLHPVIRAILLHFWLAYDHPFVDGNGRTARALFYWSMLRQGYPLAEYLSISKTIAGQPRQYVRAYQNTQRDDNDLTYFILYHLKVIERSLGAFEDYLAAKTGEQSGLNQLLSGAFNARQRALLTRALKDPNTLFSYESHANSHGVTIFTARADILELEKLKLLKGNRKGRRFEFLAVPNLRERLTALAERESA